MNNKKGLSLLKTSLSTWKQCWATKSLASASKSNRRMGNAASQVRMLRIDRLKYTLQVLIYKKMILMMIMMSFKLRRRNWRRGLTMLKCRIGWNS